MQSNVQKVKIPLKIKVINVDSLTPEELLRKLSTSFVFIRTKQSDRR